MRLSGACAHVRVQAHARLMARVEVGQVDAMQAISVVAAAMPSVTHDLDFLQAT